MNDFDRLLQIELRRMLDPVVATPAPTRRGRPVRKRPALRVLTSGAELQLAPVTIPVAVARLVP